MAWVENNFDPYASSEFLLLNPKTQKVNCSGNHGIFCGLDLGTHKKENPKISLDCAKPFSPTCPGTRFKHQMQRKWVNDAKSEPNRVFRSKDATVLL